MMEEPVFHGDYSFNTGEVKVFSAVDYVFFALVLACSAAIGFYFAFKERNKSSLKDFLLAGGDMSPYPVSLSLLASFMSAITLLGTPAEMYNYTTIYVWIGLGYVFTIAGAAHLYIPIFYNLRVTSAYEYLERRFSKSVRTLASCTFVFQMILYMAIVLYAPSLALNAVTGFNLWGSVISVGVICTIYTAVGGMKAVLWTDCFQVVMMFAGQLAILIKGAMVVGGWGPAYESAQRMHRVLWTEWSFDPSVRHTIWSLVIGGYFTWVAIFGVNQAMVQRAVTCKTLKDAQKALWINVPGLWLILYLGCLIGMFLSAFYEKCDVKKAGFVKESDQLLPIFVMDILADVTGLPGLFVAGLFSGALSTISSGLNSISAVLLEDVVKAYFIKDCGEVKAKRITQTLAIVFGVICLGLTVVASQLGGVLQAALSIFGMVGGPLLGVFTLGMFFPWANAKGAFVGLVTGLVFLFWIGIGASVVKPPQTKALTSTVNCNISAFDNETRALVMAPSSPSQPPEWTWDYPIYTVSYIWYSLVAVLTVVIVGLIVSLITGATDPSSLDARLICPACDIVFPFYFLPESIRKPLRYGIVHEGKYDNYISPASKEMNNITLEVTADSSKELSKNQNNSTSSYQSISTPTYRRTLDYDNPTFDKIE